MKLLSFEVRGKQSFGVLAKAGGIIDLQMALQGKYRSLKHILCQDSLGEVGDCLMTAQPDYTLEEVNLMPPIPNPGKIICVGVNYRNRNAEYKDHSDLPKYPSIFMRTRESFTGHGTNLIRPPESPQLDYEGEITLIIGKPGRRIREEDAEDHIAALTIMNEGTIRDWVRHAKFNVTQGKNFPKSGAMGPWAVTLDEVRAQGLDLEDLHLQTRVNGEIRQDDSTRNMMFPIRYLISYISTFTELKPGDVIATGTPTGAGARFDPPKYLVPGDHVEVDVTGIGLLANGIEDELI